MQYHRNYHGLDVRGADCEKPKPTNNVTSPSQNTHALKVLQKISYSTPPLSVPQKQQCTRNHSPTRESMIRSQNAIFKEFINGIHSSADTQQKNQEVEQPLTDKVTGDKNSSLRVTATKSPQNKTLEPVGR